MLDELLVLLMARPGKSTRDRPGRAGPFTPATADAFWVVGFFHRIQVHAANFGAGAAIDAFVPIHPVTEHGNPLK